MKVIAYPTVNDPPKLVVANSKREWMDNAVNKNPYRCLPLSMANSWGWQILSKSKFIAEWNGGKAPSDVKITPIEGTDFPVPHFGEGTLTWHLGYVFSTPYPYGVYMTGAPNNPKPNVVALSGVVETHWLPYTATMNWRFTQIGSFTMDIGEPFCQVFPVDMSLFENVVPEIRSMDEADAKEFYDLYWDWNLSRGKFMTEQRVGMHGAEVWQRHYFQGVHPPDGSRKCPFHTKSDGTVESVHITKPGVPEFTDHRIGPFKTPDYYWQRSKEIAEMEKQYLEQANRPQGQTTTEPTNAVQVQPQITEEEFEAKVRHFQEQLKITIEPKKKTTAKAAKKSKKKEKSQ